MRLMMVHAWFTWKPEEEGSPGVRDQPGLHSEYQDSVGYGAKWSLKS